MTRYIGLLRAVNVGGVTLRMDDLRRTLDAGGIQEVQTLLQSGNVVFRDERRFAPELERYLQTELLPRIGIETEVFVRAAAEWHDLVRKNPLPERAREDPGRLLVSVLKRAPTPSAWAELRSASPGPETIREGSRHAYIYYPEGSGRSKLTQARIDRVLGIAGTSRNWNTVLKLDGLASR